MSYIDPVLPLCLLLISIAAVWSWRSKSPGRRLLALGAVGLFVWSFPPVSWLFSATLEARYPATFVPRGEAEAIVVLASGLYTASAARPAVRLGPSTEARTEHAAWLHNSWRPLPVLASGGATPTTMGNVLAAEMAKRLREEGIPDEQIWIEGKSTSTYLNAVYSAEILRQHGIRRIVLVTEAYHMLRAELCFRKQGLEVIPAPVDFHSKEYSYRPIDYLPSSSTTKHNDQVLHEWGGLVYYWLMGRF